ncbi:MAG TPA: multicopper oxidase domain-containing protein [Anaerolineae bacterium]|nr:multicopper oxidase domain-containing protein [Anaerolineae bacterium]
MARKDKLNLSRRDFLRTGAFALAGLALPGRRDIGQILASRAGGTSADFGRILADVAMLGLSDPALQPKFVNLVPDALAPDFIFQPDKKGRYKIKIGPAVQQTGLRANGNGALLNTPVWGYGDQKDKLFTWPGRTFQINNVSAGGPPETEVFWANALDGVAAHLLPVDTSLHWAYSLPGYQQYTIAANGVPIVTHLHGGHTDFQFDGNPEFFYGPGGANQVIGPQWNNVPGGFTTKFRYDNNVSAGNLWYHDHALGLTRLNVYAGLAGFYFVRDGVDTGLSSNPLGLPAWPYEKAYAIQDRMFRATGELFYPAFPGDPYYADFITGEGAVLPPGIFPGGGPTALAEFFGDHMVVNGVIWPKEDVEPRNYRLHLLNGTDSRFMVIRFRQVPAGATDLADAGAPLPFHVIGSDQGLASAATETIQLLSEPGSRYDIVFDFKGLQGQRIIMENIGGDEPFGGEIPGPRLYGETDRIMSFDVVDSSNVLDAFDPTAIDHYGGNSATVDRVRKVALFEGKDEYGRLQPLLGVAEPTVDAAGNTVSGALPWHAPTTENPALNSTEIWEIYNATGDAHPVHLHLVNFQVGTGDEATYGVTRQAFTADMIQQPVLQHNGTTGIGFRLESIVFGNPVPQPDGYIENAPKDMVTALPGQVTRIKATFDKPGRYVWHCHILSHEDHEMMRVLHVGPGA